MNFSDDFIREVAATANAVTRHFIVIIKTGMTMKGRKLHAPPFAQQTVDPEYMMDFVQAGVQGVNNDGIFGVFTINQHRATTAFEQVNNRCGEESEVIASDPINQM